MGALETSSTFNFYVCNGYAVKLFANVLWVSDCCHWCSFLTFFVCFETVQLSSLATYYWVYFFLLVI